MAVPSFTQTKTYSTNTAATSHALTLDSAITPSGGSVSPSALILALSYDGSSGNQCSSVTDTQGNTWARATSASNGTGTNGELWYTYNVLGGSTPTITANMSSSVKMSMVAAEIDQVRCVTPLDLVLSRIDTTNSTARSSASTTSTKRNGMLEIVIGAIAWSHATLDVNTAGTGFTQLTKIKDGSSNIGCAIDRRSTELNNLTPNNTIGRFVMTASSTTPCAVMSMSFYRDGVSTSTMEDGYIDNFETFVTVVNADTISPVYMSSTSAPNGGTGFSEKINSYGFIPTYDPYLLPGVTIGSNMTFAYYVTYGYEDGTDTMFPYLEIYNDGTLGTTLDSSDETFGFGYTVALGYDPLTTLGILTLTVPTSLCYSDTDHTTWAMHMEGDTLGSITSTYLELLTREGNASSYFKLDLQYPYPASSRLRTLMGVGL